VQCTVKITRSAGAQHGNWHIGGGGAVAGLPDLPAGHVEAAAGQLRGRGMVDSVTLHARRQRVVGWRHRRGGAAGLGPPGWSVHRRTTDLQVPVPGRGFDRLRPLLRASPGCGSAPRCGRGGRPGCLCSAPQLWGMWTIEIARQLVARAAVRAFRTHLLQSLVCSKLSGESRRQHSLKGGIAQLNLWSRFRFMAIWCSTCPPSAKHGVDDSWDPLPCCRSVTGCCTQH
jgi:hypothetical protein